MGGSYAKAESGVQSPKADATFLQARVVLVLVVVLILEAKPSDQGRKDDEVGWALRRTCL
jgi:hypothetical protein